MGLIIHRRRILDNTIQRNIYFSEWYYHLHSFAFQSLSTPPNCHNLHWRLFWVTTAGLTKSHARIYYLFTVGYQMFCILVSIISSPVARKVIRATKHNKDLSTPTQEPWSVVISTGSFFIVQINTKSCLTVRTPNRTSLLLPEKKR